MNLNEIIAEGPDNSPILVPNHKEAAIIKFPRNVVGGHDALAFSANLEDLSNRDFRYIVVDLQQVEIINSSGLGMLVSGLATLRKYNVKMAVSNIPAKIFHIFEMTHLNEILKIYKDAEEAIEAFK